MRVPVSQDQMLVCLSDNFKQSMRRDNVAVVLVVLNCFSYHQYFITLLDFLQQTYKPKPIITQQDLKIGSIWSTTITFLKSQLQSEFKSPYQSMKPTSQTNSEEKINNIFGNFSTSESTHSKNTNKASTNQVQSAEKKPLQLLQLHQLQSKKNMESKCNEQNEEVSRLFTFMDEKEAERKIIQNYIKKDSLHKRYHNQLYEPKLTKHCQGIVKMIQDSRKKREEFIKKVTNNTLCLKQNKSNSRLNRISRSKTPKQMPYFGRNKNNFQSKYDTLQPRSRSKTPKLEPHKYRTPKSEMQIRLFRAKSNLGKQKSKRQNRQIRDLSMVQFKEQISPIRQNCLTQRQLLQKKKDLERQLNAVNESLLNCKKPAQPKKKVKTVKNNNRKSRGKLSKW